MVSLTERLQQDEVILIDGGTGTELEIRGVPMTEGIWCGLTALSHPSVVQRVHEVYIGAGAELIISDTYASSRHLLAHVGEDSKFEEVNRRGVELACAAREAAGRPEVTVAGSISTTQMEWSHPPVDLARRNYADQARIQAGAGADLIVLEMLRDVEQTMAAVEGVATAGLPIWAGFSCVLDGDTPMLYDGRETLAAGLEAIAGLPIELVAIMHTELDIVDRCLDVIQEHWHGPVGAYSQLGHFVPPHWVFTDTVSAADYARAGLHWVERGVQVVGGCCGIGPEHIAALRAVLPHHR